MPTTVRNTDILFNDGTTQSTAASGVPASITAVGSIIIAANGSTSNLLPGSTVAGSSLYYTTTVTTYYVFGPQVQGPNLFAGNSNFSMPSISMFGLISDGRGGNTGWQPPGGHTALSGTWRSLWVCGARGSQFDSYSGSTSIATPYGLFQRIA